MDRGVELWHAPPGGHSVFEKCQPMSFSPTETLKSKIPVMVEWDYERLKDI